MVLEQLVHQLSLGSDHLHLHFELVLGLLLWLVWGPSDRLTLASILGGCGSALPGGT